MRADHNADSRQTTIWTYIASQINGETLPKGQPVETPDGGGRVVRVDPERGETLVELADGRRGWFSTLDLGLVVSGNI